MTGQVMPIPPPAEFLDAAQRLAIEFDPDDLPRLGRYLAMLLDASTRINLTAVTDPDQAWTRHILDSLTLLPLMVSFGARTVVDVGSGGGLPGVPLAIALPDVHFTLVEATGKKTRFLEEAAAALKLDNTRIINDRTESIGQDHTHHRGKYDVAIARAVGPLPVLLELAIPLVKVGGHVLAMKGAKAQEDITRAGEALKLLGAQVAGVHPTPTGVIVVIEKRRPTPRLYPRAPGQPKRKPLR